MAERAGIRELRQNLSRYVERVKRGESIEVTEHGRLVAVLAPAADRESELASLAHRGLAVRAPRLELSSLGRPPRPRRGNPLPSETLAALRDRERY